MEIEVVETTTKAEIEIRRKKRVALNWNMKKK
jgi:hypothetical protein